MAGISDEESRIKDVLREQPLGMNIKEIAGAVGMSRNSVAKYLDVLTATGHLDVRQIGNAKLYYLSHRVPVQNLLQLTAEMIVVLDRTLRIVQASDSFAAFLGIVPGQVTGRRMSRLPVPVLTEREENELTGLLGSGEPWSKEIRLVKNGTPVYLSARFVPAVFDGGNPGITVIFENVTGQRMTEIALMEKERFLFNVLQVSPTPKFLLDRNHKITFWNRAMEIMTRLRTEDMVGTSDQWKAFYPTRKPCLADLLIEREGICPDAARSRSRAGSDHPCEIVEFFPDLGPAGKWLHCTAAVIRDSQGNLTGAMETIEDVTAAKQREFSTAPRR